MKETIVNNSQSVTLWQNVSAEPFRTISTFKLQRKLFFHADIILEFTLSYFMLSRSGQCISPGIVETEFAFRLHNSDPEKAASVYESIKVSQVCVRLPVCNYGL